MEMEFAQFGWRFSAQEKRDHLHSLEISFVCIHSGFRPFRMEAFEQIEAVARAAGPRAEVIFIDLDAEKNRIDSLLAHFPSLRILVPASPRGGFADAVFLGMREALAPYVVILNTEDILIDFDIDSVLESFRLNLQLIALGPACVDEEGREQACFLFARLHKGRLKLRQGAYNSGGAGISRRFAQGASFEMLSSGRGIREGLPPRNALLLPQYIGVYAREKVLFIPPPEVFADPAWACLEWFYSAWARGWQSRVDPRFCLMSVPWRSCPQGEPASKAKIKARRARRGRRRLRKALFADIYGSAGLLFPQRTFGERARFYRNELSFLRRHNLPAKFFRSLWQSGPAFLFAWLSRKIFVRPARGEVRGMREIFAMLQEEAEMPARDGGPSAGVPPA
jgi:hypothetical protein